jgi:hypothetical protein
MRDPSSRSGRLTMGGGCTVHAQIHGQGTREYAIGNKVSARTNKLPQLSFVVSPVSPRLFGLT